MPISGEYQPSPTAWVRNQVQEYESSGGTAGTTLRGLPVVVVTTVGVKSGKVRKVPLMRVEHDGSYALVASKGGAPEHPVWYRNLLAEPHITLQDGPLTFDAVVRELTGSERTQWWARAGSAYPDYADYQLKTDRQIPVFIAEPVSN